MNLFKPGSFPKGEIQQYREAFNAFRANDPAKVAADTAITKEEYYDMYRTAAECHRQVRAYAQSIIKPGIKLIDMCDLLENKNRELVQEAGLTSLRGRCTPSLSLVLSRSSECRR